MQFASPVITSRHTSQVVCMLRSCCSHTKNITAVLRVGTAQHSCARSRAAQVALGKTACPGLRHGNYWDCCCSFSVSTAARQPGCRGSGTPWMAGYRSGERYKRCACQRCTSNCEHADCCAAHRSSHGPIALHIASVCMSDLLLPASAGQWRMRCADCLCCCFAHVE
jgi:hypothetical protein